MSLDRGACRRLLVLLFFLSPVLSCSTVKEAIWPPTPTPTATATPTPTPTPTPTATRVPIAQRDFADILLQKEELPDGFMQIDLPHLEDTFSEMLGGAATSELESVLEEIVTGYARLFSSEEEIYTNMILVYPDPGFAQTAFVEYRDLIAGQEEEIDAEQVGEESAMFDQSSRGVVYYFILWRYQEAILNLQYAGEDGIEPEDFLRLAQSVQTRLEAG
ncbi:MAG: hypothetical protein JW929_12340 [Anaerolineales bacterium]|nr:hypothetical protein [Anaerolineales bacterium]